MRQHIPHPPRLHRRDAGLRSVKHITAWTAVGGLAMTGALAVVAERAFSGVQTVTAAEPDATDPAAGIEQPVDTIPIATVPAVPAPIVPSGSVATQAPVTVPPTTSPPVEAVPIVPPTVAPTAPPTTVVHHKKHHTAVVVSGGS